MVLIAEERSDVERPVESQIFKMQRREFVIQREGSTGPSAVAVTACRTLLTRILVEGRESAERISGI
jgi:hypothetical protein